MSFYSESTASVFCRSFMPRRDRLAEILESVETWCAKKNLDESARKKVTTILDVIVSGLHGAVRGPETPSCLLILSRSENRLVMDVEQDGPVFNPLEIKKADPALTPSPEEQRIAEARRSAERIEFKYDKEARKNILTVSIRTN